MTIVRVLWALAMAVAVAGCGSYAERAQGGGMLSDVAVEPEPKGDAAGDNTSSRLVSLEERVCQIEARLAASDKARSEWKQKIESDFWGCGNGH